MSQLWAFALFAAVLTVTPGLDTMLVLRTTALNGRRSGLAAVFGVGLGCLAWAAASALGVTAVLSASRLAFDVLRFAGVGYLCWLGGRALWQARRPAATFDVGVASTGIAPSGVPSTGVTPTGVTPSGVGSIGGASSGAPGDRTRFDPPGESARWVAARRAFRTGFTTNLLNPKVGVFYLSVMPQFLPAGANPLVGSLGLGAIHVAEGLIWLSLVVLAVNRARGWLTRPTVKRRLEQLTGVAFLGFGLRLALTPDHG